VCPGIVRFVVMRMERGRLIRDTQTPNPQNVQAETLVVEEMEAYWTNFARSTATPNNLEAAPAPAESAPPLPADKEAKGGAEEDVEFERRESKEKAAHVRASLGEWPAFKGENVFVFDDGAGAVNGPDRLAFCAFWDQTKVYTD
jgi:hypothetical protein